MDTVVPLTATYNNVAKSGNLTVLAALVSSVQLSPATLIGSTSSAANKVVLTGPAPTGGLDVQLNSDLAAAVPPGLVHVADGTTQATFTITTSPVASTVAAHITGTLGASSKQATLTLTPIAVSALTIACHDRRGHTVFRDRDVECPGGRVRPVVQLTTSNSTLFSLPPTVTIPIGSTRSAAIPSYDPTGNGANLDPRHRELRRSDQGC